jgi:hypothetical protein
MSPPYFFRQHKAKEEETMKWAIRSQVLKHTELMYVMDAVQRLDGGGEITLIFIYCRGIKFTTILLLSFSRDLEHVGLWLQTCMI